MQYIKEDGSLDIEKLNDLPCEDYTRVISELTQQQYKEYVSKLPLNEVYEPIEIIDVDYTLEEDIKRNGLVDADKMFDEIREKYCR